MRSLRRIHLIRILILPIGGRPASCYRRCWRPAWRVRSGSGCWATLVVAGVAASAIGVAQWAIHRAQRLRPVAPIDRASPEWLAREDALARARVFLPERPNPAAHDLSRNPRDARPSLRSRDPLADTYLSAHPAPHRSSTARSTTARSSRATDARMKSREVAASRCSALGFPPITCRSSSTSAVTAVRCRPSARGNPRRIEPC